MQGTQAPAHTVDQHGSALPDHATWKENVGSEELEALLQTTEQADMKSDDYDENAPYPTSYASGLGHFYESHYDEPTTHSNDPNVPYYVLRYGYEYQQNGFAPEDINLFSAAGPSTGFSQQQPHYRDHRGYANEFRYESHTEYIAPAPQVVAPVQHQQAVLTTNAADPNAAQGPGWSTDDILKLYRLKTVTKKGINFILERFPGETKESITAAWKAHKAEGKRLFDEQRAR